MYVKIMSGENKADRDADKLYRLIECNEVQFIRDPGAKAPAVVIDGAIHSITGNVYILNNAGKTVDSFWPSDLIPVTPGTNPPIAS